MTLTTKPWLIKSSNKKMTSKTVLLIKKPINKMTCKIRRMRLP